MRNGWPIADPDALPCRPRAPVTVPAVWRCVAARAWAGTALAGSLAGLGPGGLAGGLGWRVPCIGERARAPGEACLLPSAGRTPPAGLPSEGRSGTSALSHKLKLCPSRDAALACVCSHRCPIRYLLRPPAARGPSHSAPPPPAAARRPAPADARPTEQIPPASSSRRPAGTSARERREDQGGRARRTEARRRAVVATGDWRLGPRTPAVRPRR